MSLIDVVMICGHGLILDMLLHALFNTTQGAKSQANLLSSWINEGALLGGVLINEGIIIQYINNVISVLVYILTESHVLMS